jgi:hypothetical protein
MNVSALTRLAGAIQTFRNGIALDEGWIDRQGMTETLARVRQRHPPPGVARIRQRDRVLARVTAYRHSGQVARPDEVFVLCRGAAWLDAQGQGILSDPALREKLLLLAATLTGRKLRLKAFRHLLFAYWSFPLYDATTPPEAVAGWQALRAWLRTRLAEIAGHPAQKPVWFQALAAHRHLLDDAPCAPFANALLNGRLDELQGAIDTLSIPVDSWVRQAAILAQVDAACARPDASFLALLPGLIDLAGLTPGETAVRITDPLARRILGRLLVRCSRLGEHAPQETLFRLAIDRIGNPWRQQPQWEVDVCRDDGNPCSTSREMVAGWLKDQVISGFFASGDRAAPRRELWQRYSVFMQALTRALPWGGRRDPALLASMGRFLVKVPQDVTATIEIYPWQMFVMRGGAKLLENDTADGMAVQRVLERCKPVASLDQGDMTECETTLRGLLFAVRG